ncbi:MAG: hypothetical protein E6Q97_35680 [Desulfurellales bacterium]|nr:MAG: hypothetical protein E6Q97_35680 [Desulfurellales bacterium]
MGTAEIYELLAQKYAGGEWVFVTEVPDGTGSEKCRTADAIAVGCWQKTRGRLIGHEVKASRSDWKKECEQPEKSLLWRQQCSEWYLVAASGVAKLEEVPADWGFLEVSKKGDKLLTRRMSPAKDPGPISMNFLAAITRRALGHIPHETRKQLAEANDSYRSGYAAGKDSAEKAVEHRLKATTERLEFAHKNMLAFGLNAYSSVDPDSIEAKLYRAIRKSGMAEQLRWKLSQAVRLAEECDRVCSVVREFAKNAKTSIDEIEAAIDASCTSALQPEVSDVA